MRVVVTGGSGLIGRALVSSLLEDSHQAVIVSRDPARLDNLPAGAETAKWDGRTAAELVPTLDGADAVVHLAGESIASGRWTEARKKRILDSRVLGTSAVATAFEAAPRRPGVLVQGSAVGYYGPRGGEKLGEDAAAGDDFLATVCRRWEAASEAAGALGVRRAIARTGVVLAADGGALPRIALPFKLFAGGPVAGGGQWFPWIHIADEVGAIRFLLDHPDAAGPFNLSAPHPVTNRELGRVLGKVLRRPSFLPTPGFALELALGEMATIVVDGQRAVPERLEAAGYRFRFAELEPALRDVLT